MLADSQEAQEQQVRGLMVLPVQMEAVVAVVALEALVLRHHHFQAVLEPQVLSLVHR
jgi:hypothetical protein